jgi:hypothetical protein
MYTESLKVDPKKHFKVINILVQDSNMDCDMYK